MAFTRIGGNILHWRVFGRETAPAIVFSNSLGSDLRIWADVAARLGGRSRIVLYDKRGHGLSDAPPGPYALDDHVDDLTALLDHIGIARATIVGLSVGGMIAQRLAARAPRRVAALVLCDTAARIGTVETWNARIATVQKSGIAAIADGVLERWFTKKFRVEQADDLAGWRNMLTRTPVEGYAATCATVRDADLRADAASIRAPTLLVVGDEDGSTPPDLVRGTADLIAGSTFEIIAGAGHIPCIEQPGILADLIARHQAEAEADG